MPLLPIFAANVVENVPTREFTRGDVVNLWFYAGIGVLFVVIVIALIMWYRHRLRDEANVGA